MNDQAATTKPSDYDDQRRNISGIFTYADAETMLYPRAWSGFIGPKERSEREAAYADVAHDIMEVFDTSGEFVKSVTVEAGDIVEHEVYSDEEIEVQSDLLLP